MDIEKNFKVGITKDYQLFEFLDTNRLPNQKIIKSIGKIEGHISPSMKGKNGFGYDPIFIPKGKKITFGEMKASQKYKIDHRSKAFKKIKKFF